MGQNRKNPAGRDVGVTTFPALPSGRDVGVTTFPPLPSTPGGERGSPKARRVWTTVRTARAETATLPRGESAALCLGSIPKPKPAGHAVRDYTDSAEGEAD